MESIFITISQEEYKKLCRLEARMDIAQDYLDRNRYTTTSDLITILGLEERKDKGGNINGNVI